MLAIDPVAVPLTNAAGIVIGVGVFRDMVAAYTAGMWLAVPWFLWRRRPAEAAYVLAANSLFTFASRRELGAYFEKRRSGELAPLPSLREFLRSYSTMTRQGESDEQSSS